MLSNPFRSRPCRQLTTSSPSLSTEPIAAPTKLSRLRSLLTFTFTAVFCTTLGTLLVMATALKPVGNGDLYMQTDEETLSWEPSTDEERAHDEYLKAHPLVRALRADPALTEMRPHLKVPRVWRQSNLTAGVLMGPGKMPFPPVAWLDAEGPARSYVEIGYAGEALCGHPGIVHGGFLATMLDEGLARAAFAALPHGVGVTASLSINYKAPCEAGQYVVLRGELTNAEGRKAWVEGRLETLPVGDEEPVVLATATALYIEPKGFEVR